MRIRIFAFIFIILMVSSLSSCSGSLLTEVNCDEYTCQLYGSGYVKKIIVTSDDNTIATFKVGGSKVTDNNYGFELIDMNFDGYPDMRQLFSTGINNGSKYNCWIWNNSTKTFSVDNTLDSLYNPTIDNDMEIVSATYRTHTIDPAVGTEPETYIDEAGTITYKWRQEILIAIRKECTSYYSESDIYCVAVWDINSDGELDATEEHWMTPAQYERAGYQPIE